MTVVLLIVFIALVALATRYGADSRDGRDWKSTSDLGRDIVVNRS